MVKPFSAPLKTVSQTKNVSGPETRITAIPPVPGGVEIAQIVSFIVRLFILYPPFQSFILHHLMWHGISVPGKDLGSTVSSFISFSISFFISPERLVTEIDWSPFRRIR